MAGLVGRSESWLSQVERGLRRVDSLVVLRELARVLRVGLDDLAPSSTPALRGSSEPAATVMERALLAAGLAAPTTGPRVAAAHAAYQRARYGDVLADLPELVAQLSATDDAGVFAAGWVLVAKMLTKVGTFDLALLAADRARESAHRTGDVADKGMAVYQVVCALLPTPRASIGEQLAVCTAVDLDPGDAGRGGGDDPVGSVAGALWLIAAIAAARRGDAYTAQERLELAQRLADRVGRDANVRWTGFGPTNVALHRVSVAAELGDAAAALAAARGLDARRFPPALQGRLWGSRTRAGAADQRQSTGRA